MANIITASRLILLLALVLLAYYAPAPVQQINAPLLALIIMLDGVDGYVARKRRETSVFGAIFDIAVDRVVEIVLWVVLSDLGLIPVWVPLLFIVRGVIVDSIRYAAISEGETAFGMMKSPIGRFVVAGRFMRGLYGTVKALTFGWVLLIQPWPVLHPEFWARHEAELAGATMTLVVLAAALCVIRGAPVVVEFLAKERPFTV